jgi:putative copper export protein
LTDYIAIGLRALEFSAVLQAAGVALFLWLFGGGLERAARPIGTLAVSTAAAGLVLSIGHALVEPARLAGELSGIFDPSLQGMLLASDAGTTTAIRVLGLAMVAGGSLKPSRLGTLVALMGATLIAASFAFMGHTTSDNRRWLLAALLILHLMLVAFWFGALWPLLMAVKRESLAVAGRVIEEFSRVAVWLVPIVFFAGLGLAVALVPDLTSLRTPYGRLLLTKVAGFALLMGLAVLNKWRLGARIARGEGAVLQAFRRAVLAEWVLIVGVVTVTATMTGLFSAAGH